MSNHIYIYRGTVRGFGAPWIRIHVCQLGSDLIAKSVWGVVNLGIRQHW
jgi:hypothetical protein